MHGILTSWPDLANDFMKSKGAKGDSLSVFAVWISVHLDVISAWWNVCVTKTPAMHSRAMCINNNQNCAGVRRSNVKATITVSAANAGCELVINILVCSSNAKICRFIPCMSSTRIDTNPRHKNAGTGRMPKCEANGMHWTDFALESLKRCRQI